VQAATLSTWLSSLSRPGPWPRRHPSRNSRGRRGHRVLDRPRGTVLRMTTLCWPDAGGFTRLSVPPAAVCATSADVINRVAWLWKRVAPDVSGPGRRGSSEVRAAVSPPVQAHLPNLRG